ncbi:unnamed protein product [Brassicogethes aeneus]|uniref:Fibronectin type-III domain-containing protein n=1 Tax=Brassicogethes aeneus TaxID=1431903 RepID=A0A9P0AXP5_BRAAE|nr:unnamed protein product [Brassicogethes aeneus]
MKKRDWIFYVAILGMQIVVMDATYGPEAKVPNRCTIKGLQCRMHTATLHWKNGDDDKRMVKYIIQYNTSYDPDQWHTMVNFVPGHMNQWLVTMKPWATYNFRIIAVNNVGSSEPSLPTRKDCYSPRGPPKNPENVTVVAEMNKLIIRWNALKPIDQAAPALRYHVYYRRSYRGFTYKKVIVGNWLLDHIVIANQSSYYNYRVKVQSVNSFGEALSVPSTSFSHNKTTEPGYKPEWDWKILKKNDNVTVIEIETIPDKYDTNFGVYQIDYKLRDDNVFKTTNFSLLRKPIVIELQNKQLYLLRLCTMDGEYYVYSNDKFIDTKVGKPKPLVPIWYQVGLPTTRLLPVTVATTKLLSVTTKKIPFTLATTTTTNRPTAVTTKLLPKTTTNRPTTVTTKRLPVSFTTSTTKKSPVTVRTTTKRPTITTKRSPVTVRTTTNRPTTTTKRSPVTTTNRPTTVTKRLPVSFRTSTTKKPPVTVRTTTNRPTRTTKRSPVTTTNRPTTVTKKRLPVSFITRTTTTNKPTPPVTFTTTTSTTDRSTSTSILPPPNDFSTDSVDLDNDDFNKEMLLENEEALTIFLFVLIAFAGILALVMIVMFVRSCVMIECLYCCRGYKTDMPPMMIIERGVSSSGGSILDLTMEAKENLKSPIEKPTCNELKTFKEYKSFDEIQICNEVPFNVTNVPPPQPVPKGILQTQISNTLERNKKKAMLKKSNSIKWSDDQKPEINENKEVPLLMSVNEPLPNDIVKNGPQDIVANIQQNLPLVNLSDDQSASVMKDLSETENVPFPNITIVNGPQEAGDKIQPNISVVDLSEKEQLCCFANEEFSCISTIQMSDGSQGNMAPRPKPKPKCFCKPKPPVIKGYEPGLPTVSEYPNDAKLYHETFL